MAGGPPPRALSPLGPGRAAQQPPPITGQFRPTPPPSQGGPRPDGISPPQASQSRMGGPPPPGAERGGPPPIAPTRSTPSPKPSTPAAPPAKPAHRMSNYVYSGCDQISADSSSCRRPVTYSCFIQTNL
jgi:hypothetical protein